MLVGKAWGPASLTLKCRPAAERSESKSHVRSAERWAGVKKHQAERSRWSPEWEILPLRSLHMLRIHGLSESMDFKHLVNFSELAQPHYIACSFWRKYLCKYRSCFSSSFGTERYWRFRRSFSISVSVLVHSGSGQIVRCMMLNVGWKFGADTVTQREVIRGEP